MTDGTKKPTGRTEPPGPGYFRRWFGRAGKMTLAFVKRHLVLAAAVSVITFAVVAASEPPDVVTGQYRFVVDGLAALILIAVIVLAYFVVVTPRDIERELARTHQDRISAEIDYKHRAEAALEDLEARLNARPLLRVTVDMLPAERHAIDLTDAARAAWRDAEGKRYMDAAEKYIDDQRADAASIFSRARMWPEGRSMEDYAAEVRAYLQLAWEHWIDGVAVGAVDQRVAAVTLKIQHLGHVRIKDVTLTLTLPAGCRAYWSVDDATDRSAFPHRPREMRDGNSIDLGYPATIAPGPTPGRIEMTTEDTVVRYLGLDIMPDDRQRLPPFFLAADQSWADRSIRAEWMAATTSIDEPATGSVDIRIASEVIRPETLLPVGQYGLV